MANRTPPPDAAPRNTIEVIDPRWLLKMGGVVILAALFCAWLTLCGLFYQGQWQFVLQPSRTAAKNPTAIGLTFEPVRFAVDASGTPQLSGWWVPAEGAGSTTALVLHGGSGSLDDTLPLVLRLHTARLNVLVFDYHGYGGSGGQHPTEALLQQDAAAAFDYLTVTRHIAANRIVPFGQGVGAALAVRLATEHPEMPAVILDTPVGDIEAAVAHDPRTFLVPTRLLLHERFPLAAPLSTLKTPKLIFNAARSSSPVAARLVADPKMTVELPAGASDVAYVQSLSRFLDLYTSTPAQLLTLPAKP